ncbi:MAG: glycosyltransferase family 39 protein, partial [Desulfovibrio sp.]|nr:glycosyltransferase family 39 protein [Desulfovibrio sp.]
MEKDILDAGSGIGAAPGESENASAGDGESGTPTREGRLQKCFEGASRLGPLLLLCVLALYVWPEFSGKTFYFPPESENSQILGHVMKHGTWMAPSAGGVAQWPGFSACFTIILKFLRYFGELAVFPALIAGLGAFCSFLTLLGAWCLSLSAGFGPRAALSAGLILLCAPISALLVNFVSPETLAVALTLFSFCCFCRGWQKEKPGLAVPSGCLLAALAALTGGPYYLFLPFLSSLIFLCWLGRVRRVQKPDAVFGFALCLVLIAAWLGSVMLGGHADGYLQQLRGAFLPSGNPQAASWWRPMPDAGAALLALFPWPALVAFVSWTRVAGEAVNSFKAARAECSGSAYVWIAFACAVLLSPLASDPVGPGMMICGLAALLLGKALLRLSNFGSRFFYLFVVLCLLISAVGLTALSFGYSRDWLAQTFHLAFSPRFSGDPALPGIGLCCLAAAFILVRFTNLTKPAGALLACTLLAAVLVQPVMVWLEPRFGDLYIMLWRRGGIEKNVGLPEQRSAVPTEKAPDPQSASKPEQSGQADAPTESSAIPDNSSAGQSGSSTAEPVPKPGDAAPGPSIARPQTPER